MSSELRLFYVPISSQEKAKEIASLLLKENLIACANIFQPHLAIYRWEGRVETESEIIMILKTGKAKAEKLKERLHQVHPYDCPCLIEIKPDSVNKDFMNWVNEQIQ
jgi:periplasmic divalent cation tolerance protein